MTKQIPLTQGKVALVDDEDFERINTHKWHAWTAHNLCYAVRWLPKKKLVRMHQEITGTGNKVEIDHRDGNGLNNQRHNLRVVTHTQNMQNRTKHCKSSSQFKGVWWDAEKHKWRAEIAIYGKHIKLGVFDDEREAALRYDARAREAFGEFAKTNF